MICSFFYLTRLRVHFFLQLVQLEKKETKKTEKNVRTRAFNLIGLLSTFYIYNSLGKKNNSSPTVDSVHDRIAQQEIVYETNTRCQERR